MVLRASYASTLAAFSLGLDNRALTFGEQGTAALSSGFDSVYTPRSSIYQSISNSRYAFSTLLNVLAKRTPQNNDQQYTEGIVFS